MPELASTAAQLLADGVEGRELGIFRASRLPRSLAQRWAANPLRTPVAVLPVGDGIRALVLDSPGPSAWRLVELELAPGTLEREIATGTGDPAAMAFESDNNAVLVATNVLGSWRVDRVELESGVTERFQLVSVGDAAAASGRVRGIASLGPTTAFITAGRGLVRVDYSGIRAVRASTVLSGLESPWGIVPDALHAGRVYVAERDYAGPAGVGRVLSIDVGTHDWTPVVIGPVRDGVAALQRPRAIALSRNGSRLLALCDSDPSSGAVELRGLDLGGASTAHTFLLGGPLPSDVASITTGPHDLVLCARRAGDVLAGGGIEQRRTIVGYDSKTRAANVDAAFAPALERSAAWRIVDLRRGTGRENFVWDSSDVSSGGEVFFRATPLDTELGLVSETNVSKNVVGAFADPAIEIAIGDSPADVVAADMDSDGDLDLVTANPGSDTLTIFWQTGAGAFDPIPRVLGGFPAIITPTSVVAADIDGDGDMDLASANTASHSLAIFWQTDTGEFESAPQIVGGFPTIGAPVSVVAADIDGDGDVDLVSANSASDTLTVFWQTRAGEFDPIPRVVGGPSTIDGPACVIASDIDGDGDLDLVSANSSSDPRGYPLSNSLTVFRQTRAGEFDPVPRVVNASGSLNQPVDVVAADIDGDGALDLLSKHTFSGGVLVFWQTGAGQFNPIPIALHASPSIGETLSVAAADVDGDGDLDLVAAGHTSDTLAVFWQSTAGRFDPIPRLVHGDPALDGPVSVIAADIDGDRDVDLVSANEFSGTLTIFRQTGAAEHDPIPLIVGGSSTLGFPASVFAADVDGDEDLDLVSADRLMRQLAVFWQTSERKFDVTPRVVELDGTAAFPRSVFAADIDGDGDLDLVSANFLDRSLTVAWQTTAGEFDPVSIELIGPPNVGTPVSVTAADIDLDGDLDLVSANRQSDLLTVFWQTSRGEFDPIPRVVGGAPTNEDPVSVAVADVDGDGDPDLVSANQGSDVLKIFWQTGAGEFDPIPRVVGGPSTINRPACVVVSDVDGDGDLDLVSANQGSDTLTIFWQTDRGEFDPIPRTVGGGPTIVEPSSVAAADIDGDGDIDLVSANQASDTLTVYWQTGWREFDSIPQTLGTIAVTDFPRSVAAVDVDGDGDVDLVSANHDSNSLTIFFGGR